MCDDIIELLSNGMVVCGISSAVDVAVTVRGWHDSMWVAVHSRGIAFMVHQYFFYANAAQLFSILSHYRPRVLSEGCINLQIKRRGL